MRRLFLVLVAAFVAGAIVIPAQAQQFDTLVAFDPALGELPEAIAIDGAGNMFLTMASGEIKMVTPDGEASTYAAMPSPGENGFVTGIAFSPEGDLFAALGSFDPATHGIYRIEAGNAERFVELDVAALPNGVTFDSAGNMFVSDTFGGQILQISPEGDIDSWSDDPLLAPAMLAPLPFAAGANGIAFDAGEEHLYVVSIGTGRLIQIPVEGDGGAGAATLLVDDVNDLGGADGIAFDDEGTLYVALLTQDRIVSVAADGSISTVADGPPLNNPSDVAFGPGGETLFATNFSALRALGLQEGTPEPALLALSLEQEEEEPAATSTPEVTLPSTGTGSTATGPDSWIIAASVVGASAFLIGGAALTLRRRGRQG